MAGTLDVDQIIEDNAALDRVSGEIDVIARRWGIRVELVKIQRVEAGELAGVLARKKNADLKNKEVIINAKSNKQTRVIESEGHRDRMTREAEGEMAQTLSRGARARALGGGIPPAPPPTHAPAPQPAARRSRSSTTHVRRHGR